MQNPEIDSPAADRISSLPDEILHHILSLIPNTEDRAITSAISKRFQHLWTHQTSIRLGSTGRFLFLDSDDPDWAPSVRRYVHSVDRSLASFTSPRLRSLDIGLIQDTPALAHSSFRWVRFAGDRSVAVLRLGCASRLEIIIPHSIFTCRILISLELQGCTFGSIPDDFPGFPLLTHLKMEGSTISDNTLASLLSLCPSLRSLSLSHCRELRELKLSFKNLTELDIAHSSKHLSVRIDAPNLSVITYGGNVANLFLKNVQCLVNADICHYEYAHDGPQADITTTPLDWARPMGELWHVSRRLRVTDWFFKVALPESPTPLFANLKILHWCTHWVTAPLLRGLVLVLAQCPNLEQLYISLSGGFRRDVETCIQQHRQSYKDSFERQFEADRVCEVWDYSVFMDDSGDVIPRLKTIIVEAFVGTVNEMKMLEYLLVRGKALEKLIIGDCLMHGEEEIRRLLGDFPRSSVHVQIREKKMFA